MIVVAVVCPVETPREPARGLLQYRISVYPIRKARDAKLIAQAVHSGRSNFWWA